MNTTKRLPPAPKGWKWLRANQKVKRGDRFYATDEGQMRPIGKDDVGTYALEPLWYACQPGFCHYLRRRKPTARSK